MLTAADNCDDDVPVAYSEKRTDGTCPDRYTLVRTWTATDDCGNSASVSQTITVVDTTAPVLSGDPADATDQAGDEAANRPVREDHVSLPCVSPRRGQHR